jgi:hypothetical protein
MTSLFLALSILAPAPKPAEPQVATATLSMAGTERKLAGPLGTQWQGIGLTLVAASHIVTDATEAEWDKVEKGDHLRVRFPRPHTVRARGDNKDQTYDVSEIVIEMDGWSLKRLFLRCGDKFYTFGKYDGGLWVTLGREFLPIK